MPIPESQIPALYAAAALILVKGIDVFIAKRGKSADTALGVTEQLWAEIHDLRDEMQLREQKIDRLESELRDCRENEWRLAHNIPPLPKKEIDK